ncbi:alpha/beta fold hydrolase [Plantactinospora sp. CA-294935]|uniref:alpha/beta fold hydrolase n=1 Tax=Plantactinospora sp. CA-294935 TaxID=3240012 RepID=UPI003D8F0FFF
MSPGNIEEFTAASRGEVAYRPLLERLAREAIDAAERGEPAIASGYELSEVDLARLTGRSDDPGHVLRIRAAYGSVDGWVDDGLALIRPWGFELSSIAVPTSVWCGLSDVLRPPGHAEWLISHIPAAQRRELPGGHYLTGEDIGRVLRWLTDPAQPGLSTEPGTA